MKASLVIFWLSIQMGSREMSEWSEKLLMDIFHHKHLSQLESCASVWWTRVMFVFLKLVL